MDRRLRIGVVIGSTRQERRGEAIAGWFMELARARPELEVVPLDLREFALPLYDAAKPPRVSESYPLEVQNRWIAALAGLDGFVFVTPEYNHGYPAALKNALDYAFTPWLGRPVGFVSYGGISGGTRAVQQLRQVAIELQMAPLRDEVNIALPLRPLDERGRPNDPLFTQRANTLLDSLTWWGAALAEARARSPMPGAPKK
jgi:NAD(P)H-dependent FMN reductase